MNQTRLLLLAAFLLAGCDLQFVPITTAPPGAIADLDATCDEITLTRGAALAVACDDLGDPCLDMSIEIGDTAVADARVGYTADLSDDPYDRFNPRQVTSFVIFGKSEGETDITVRAAGGDETYRVIVVAP